jgi:hypothetical protein
MDKPVSIYKMVGSGAVTRANMRISAVSGTAFIDFSDSEAAANKLINHKGYLLKIRDSSKRAIQGYVKAAGTGETLGANLVTNGAVWTGASGATPPTGWDMRHPGVFTIFDSGDGAPYDACLKIGVNANSDWFPALKQEIVTTLGGLYYFSSDVKHGDTVIGGSIRLESSSDAEDYKTWNFTDATWATKTHYYTGITTATFIRLGNLGNIAGQYDLHDTTSLKQVTDCAATGALIVSAKDGATRAFSYIHPSFSANIASTFKIFFVGD